MATKYKQAEEETIMANEPLSVCGSNGAVAIDYDYVAGITDIMIKLSSKLGVTLKELTSKMKSMSLYDELYKMCSSQSGLTQRQTINRMYKKLAQ